MNDIDFAYVRNLDKNGRERLHRIYKDDWLHLRSRGWFDRMELEPKDKKDEDSKECMLGENARCSQRAEKAFDWEELEPKKIPVDKTKKRIYINATE
jgi:hypothetical protein